MFLSFFLFELKLRLKSISTYVYFLIWFLLTFFAVSAQDFGPIGASKVLKNGPFSTVTMYVQLTAFGIIVMSAIFGVSILRDFQLDTYQLLFTRPIKKLSYLGGRWLGSLVITLGIFSALIWGELAGAHVPWGDPTRIGHFPFSMYLKAYFSITTIQIFFLGSLFFAVAALTRRIVVVYLQGVALFGIYLIGLVAVLNTQRLDRFWPAVFDPLGILMLNSITRYWTVAEKNTQLLSWNGMFLWNRLLWSAIGVVSILMTYLFFPMSAEVLSTKRIKKRRNEAEADEESGARQLRFQVRLPAVQQVFDAALRVGQFGSLVRVRTWNIVREVPFIAIALIMAIFALVNGYEAGHTGSYNVWPVTFLMVQVVGGSGSLFLYIVAALYAGELIWRERDTHFEQIHDALPFPTWIDWLSKLGALAVAELMLLAVCALCGVVMQTFAGYYNYEFSQYLKELFVIAFVQVMIFAMYALFIQTILSNKFVGHAIAIGFYLLVPVLYRWGLENRLYLFGETTPYTYSDMNGYGHFVPALFWSITYWVCVGGLLSIMAIAFCRRGSEITLKARSLGARRQIPRFLPVIAVVLLATIGSGGWFYWNAHVRNEFRTAKQQRQRQAEYERLYKKYEKLAQPKILATDISTDLYPETRSMTAHGTFLLQNKSQQPISDVHVTAIKESVDEITFDRPSHLAMQDKKHLYSIYRLEQPLQPGETMTMNFRCSYSSHGFRDGNERAELAHNGMFFDSDYFPFIGYDQGLELDNPVYRREEHLGELEEMAPRGDPYYSNVNLFVPNADWVTFHAVVSTSPDQIAIAPGYLKRDWMENGRHYFEYDMGGTRINHFFSFISGRYSVLRDSFQNTKLEIYYHPTHTFDLDKMISSSKRGLEYFESNFGPYQFQQFRILEFPRYRGFAQSFPNTVPYSEDLGFIGRLEKPDDIDETYFVTAHELAHQWWGHQLIGSATQGSNMMSETLAEYSALMVMAKQYGPEHMRRFLKHELDGYLRGRSAEVRREPPLVLVQREPYVWYQKGSLVMYALGDYIGEDKLNGALHGYLKQYRFQNPPYPDTRSFVEALRAATPPDLQYLITDMFESITLYDNKVISATWQPTTDGKYKVKLWVQSRKLRADGDGTEHQVALHDLIEVGVFTGSKGHEEPLHVEKRWLDQEHSELEFIVDKKPTRAGIDPYNKLIDRNPEDNMKDVDRVQ